MDRVVVDTDVFSFTIRQDSRARLYQNDLRGATLCLSFMSVAELRLWSLKRNWGAARTDLLMHSISECVIIVPDESTVTYLAEISAQRNRLGRPIECGDAWIAACALRHGLPLITHNAKDFIEIPKLKVITRS